MLYKTHQRYGQLSGLIGIPVAVSVGMIPAVSAGLRFQDATLIGLTLVTAMLGATFGAEFPDCDSYGGMITKGDKAGTKSKGSIPAQKHPIISKTFRFFKVKHRGKFSHDFISIGLFFGILIFLNQMFSKHLVASVANGSTASANLAGALVLFMILFASNDLTVRYKFKYFKRMGKGVRVLITLVLAGSIALLIASSGYFNLLNWGNLNTALRTSIFYTAMSNVFLIFTLVGAYSHLIADMMTNEGVSIFGKRLAPAKTVLLLTKIPIIGVLLSKTILSSGLKTGSKWEDLCFIVVTLLCIPAFVVAFVAVSGGDVGQVLQTLRIIK